MTKLCNIKRNYLVNFHNLQHIKNEFLLFDDKQFITTSETANRVQSKYFCIKFISYVQYVHHWPWPRRMRSDVCESH